MVVGCYFPKQIVDDPGLVIPVDQLRKHYHGLSHNLGIGG
jgi:hypothetical protein